jgi:CO dehydrogenase nickel-insertion accessory protein CooC1
MKIASVLSTKGGSGKTTATANLGAFCADSNIRTLLIDLDTQPSLSSFYRLESEAPGGTYQLISQNAAKASSLSFKANSPRTGSWALGVGYTFTEAKYRKDATKANECRLFDTDIPRHLFKLSTT